MATAQPTCVHDHARRRAVYAPLVLIHDGKLPSRLDFARCTGRRSMGYLKTCTEANLSLTEMSGGVEVRAHRAALIWMRVRWGDPITCITIRMQSAGFAAIEVEDSCYEASAPSHRDRAYYSLELMIASEGMPGGKRSREFLIIARTNAARGEGLDEALRRGEAMHKAARMCCWCCQ